MKFIQKQDGSCDLTFSETEIKTLNETKKISFTAEGLKYFSNDLVRMVVQFNELFSKDIQKKTNSDD